MIFPFGQLKQGEMSLAPPKPQTDPENKMTYSADFGVRKVAGIKLDPATGRLLAVLTSASIAFLLFRWVYATCRVYCKLM